MNPRGEPSDESADSRAGRPHPSPPRNEVEVRGDHITLGQLLKAIGAAGSGGDVKRFLDEAEIRVNGEPENRRGRKLRPGDSVEIPRVGVVRLTGE